MVKGSVETEDGKNEASEVDEVFANEISTEIPESESVSRDFSDFKFEAAGTFTRSLLEGLLETLLFAVEPLGFFTNKHDLHLHCFSSQFLMIPSSKRYKRHLFLWVTDRIVLFQKCCAPFPAFFLKFDRRHPWRVFRLFQSNTRTFTRGSESVGVEKAFKIAAYDLKHGLGRHFELVS